MRSTIGSLLEGDARIVGRYQEAVGLWESLLNRGILEADTETQKSMLYDAQPAFERDCGGRALGKELMGFVGIAMLAEREDDGHYEKAVALAEILERPILAGEVKRAARDAREFLL